MLRITITVVCKRETDTLLIVVLLAFGGTAYTVDYAKQKGLYLINVVEEFEG